MKSLPNTEICQTRESRGAVTSDCSYCRATSDVAVVHPLLTVVLPLPRQVTSDCNYYRATSDGRKNVYATLTGDSSFSAVQAFSMETGMHGRAQAASSIAPPPHARDVFSPRS